MFGAVAASGRRGAIEALMLDSPQWWRALHPNQLS